MRTVTANKTKQFCKSNKYWLEYVYRHTNEPHCNRWFRNYNTSAWERDVNTLFRNTCFRHAYKEFKHKIGVEDHFNFHGMVPTIYRADLQYYASVSMYQDGSWWIYIHGMNLLDITDGSPQYRFEKILWLPTRNFKHEGIISIDSFKKTIEREFNKGLFPEGWYREYQEYKLHSKKDVINIFRTAHDCQLVPKEYDISTIEKWIRRHFKIDITHVAFEAGVKYAQKYGKQQNLVVLRYFPDYEYIYTDFDGDVDDLEREVYEMLSEYPDNTRFV